MAVFKNGKRHTPMMGFNFVLFAEDFGNNLARASGLNSYSDGVAFSKVSGISVEIGVSEYRGGADKSLFPQKVYGLASSSNITLERGMFRADQWLYNWIAYAVPLKSAESLVRQAAIAQKGGFHPSFTSTQTKPASRRIEMLRQHFSGMDQPMNLILAVLDRVSASVEKVIRIINAYPVKFSIGDFDASSSDIVIESLELSNEGIEYPSSDDIAKSVSLGLSTR